MGYAIVAFNGIQWQSPCGYTIQQAVEAFLKKHNLLEQDIRSITSLQ